MVRISAMAKNTK